MSDGKRRPPEQSETPAQLRQRASHLRWAAASIEDPERARDLLDFAAELEARADEIEAESGPR